MDEIAKARKAGPLFLFFFLCFFYGTTISVTYKLIYKDLFFCKCISGQKVIGEPVVSGLILDDHWLWDPDFTIASK